MIRWSHHWRTRQPQLGEPVGWLETDATGATFRIKAVGFVIAAINTFDPSYYNIWVTASDPKEFFYDHVLGQYVETARVSRVLQTGLVDGHITCGFHCGLECRELVFFKVPLEHYYADALKLNDTHIQQVISNSIGLAKAQQILNPSSTPARRTLVTGNFLEGLFRTNDFLLPFLTIVGNPEYNMIH